MRPLFSDFLAQCKQIEKDFYHFQEEAKRNKALIEQRRQDEAAHAKAVADEFTKWLRLMEEARQARAKAVADEFTEWLRLMEEARYHHVASLQATMSSAPSTPLLSPPTADSWPFKFASAGACTYAKPLKHARRLQLLGKPGFGLVGVKFGWECSPTILGSTITLYLVH